MVTSNGQYIYLRMGQGLKGACTTYSQFGDIVFEPLLKVTGKDPKPAIPSIIGLQERSAFTLFIDNYIAGAEDFDSIFDFLYRRYFPRVAFGPIYLASKKTQVFVDSLEIVRFSGGIDGLRPAAKYIQKAISWKTLINREELDTIIWLTLFLRLFIPGRAEYIIIIKEAYLKEVKVELPSNKKSVRRK